MKQQADWGPIWAVQRVVFQQYFKLDGRATRAEYWWFLGAYLIGRPIAGHYRGPFRSGLSIFRRACRAHRLLYLGGRLSSRRLLALWVRRCLDLGRLNETARSVLTRFSRGLVFFDPVATGANRLWRIGG